ncbi:MAG: response regulator transcription factor [Sediminibacterium sp.]
MRALIADDHNLVRKGVVRIIADAFPSAEIVDVDGAESLLEQLSNGKWDIIISDNCMPPGETGVDSIRSIKEIAPGTPVIILSMQPIEELAVRAIKSGASAYLKKDIPGDELIIAVKHVLSGRKYLTPDVADAMADAFAGDHENISIDSLSARESEVFKLLASGKSVSDIAALLTLSPNTISIFRAKIFEKMGFQNNSHLIRYAIDHKLV